MVTGAEIESDTPQGDGTTNAGDRQQAALDDQRREYCHLIRDISEDLKMCDPVHWLCTLTSLARNNTELRVQSPMGGRLSNDVLSCLLFKAIHTSQRLSGAPPLLASPF